jgi:hypothetical protein
MKYLILTQKSTEYAEAISSELWKISKPPQYWQENDVTTMYCGHVVHSDGRVALAFPDVGLVIHRDADVQPLITLITQGLPSNLAEGVANHLNNLDQIEGRMIEDVLPPLYANNLKTKEQMSGWFE